MVMRRIVEALSRGPNIKYEGLDRIPGTDVVRTYVTGSWLYSKESDMQVMLENRQKGTKNTR